MNQKIVISTCYGGFSLSPAAQKALLGKCKHIKRVPVTKYFGKDIERAQAEFNDTHSSHVFDGPDYVVVDGHEYGGTENTRDCPALVKIVESMGDAANGTHAELKVVEIPSGVQWHVDEYDGLESIHEEHRSWS